MSRLLITESMRRIIGKKAPEARPGPSVHVIQEANAAQDAAAAAGAAVGAAWGVPGNMPPTPSLDDFFACQDREAAIAQADKVDKFETLRDLELRRNPDKDRTLSGILNAASAAMDREDRANAARERREFQKWQEQR